MTEPATLPRPSDREVGLPPKPPGKSFSTFTGVVEEDEWIELTFHDLDITQGSAQYGGGQRYVWLFTVDGQEDRGVVAYFTGDATGFRKDGTPSKFRDVYTCLGVAMPTWDGKTVVNTGPFLGKRCRGMFERVQGKDFLRMTRIKPSKE